MNDRLISSIKDLTEEEIAYAYQTYGISRGLLARRLYAGMPPEEALTKLPRPYRGFREWEEWNHVAIARDISYMTFYQRIHIHGLSPEQAATLPKYYQFKEEII